MPGAVHGVFKGAEVPTSRATGTDGGALHAHDPRRRQRDARRRQAARRRCSEKAGRGRRALVVCVPRNRPRARQRHLRRRRLRRRPGPDRPRARLPARARHRRRRRGRRPRPLHGDDGRRRRVAPRRDHRLDAARRRPRAGCAATSSSASPTRPGCPSRTSSPTSTRRACPSRSRSSSPTARRAATSCSSTCARRRATAERRAPVHRRRAPGGRRRHRGRRPRAGRLGQVLDRMRAAGLVVAGMIGDPDPYTATMNALQFFRVDDIVISTLPDDALGLAARRPRSSACARRPTCPVEHVVAGADAAGGAPEPWKPPRSAHGHDARRPSRPAARPTAPRGSSPSCSGCCFSSSPRSWSSGPSSRPTSSSGSCTRRRSWFPSTGHELPDRRRRRQHRDPAGSSLTLHWARDSHQARQPLRPEGRHADDVPARAARSSSSRSTSTSTSASRRRTSPRRSIFYGLTGLHGAHVFIGLTLLAMVTVRAFRGHFSPEEHRGVEVPGHLLALRRRHVDRRLHDGLHPLMEAEEASAPGGQRRWTRLRPEAAMFRVLLWRRAGRRGADRSSCWRCGR